MSYHKMPLHASICSASPINYDVTIEYLHQYAVMLNILMHRETSSNGQSMNAILFYLTNTDEIESPMHNNTRNGIGNEEYANKKNTTRVVEKNTKA